MTEVFYTSDLHIGHRFVAGLRGFETPEEHDAALADNWSAAVSKDDTVWVLGDLTLQHPARAVRYVQALPGRKHLILGNHDKGHPIFRDSHKYQRIYLEAFESVQMAARRKIDSRNVLLSHFPYDGDHTLVNRHEQWRLRNEGEWLLHGHTHSNQVWPPHHMARHQVHVGLDAWNLTPVSQTEVLKTILEMEEAWEL